MKQLLILSGKGGTGKTTIASAFIKLAHAKAYADCDVDAPNLHLVYRPEVEAEKKEYYGLPKAWINQELCTECGLCEKYCSFDAIHFRNGYQVDQQSCEGCGLCEIVCTQKAILYKPSQSGELILYKGESVFSTAELYMGSGATGKLVTEVKKQMRLATTEADLAVIDGSPGIGCPVIASLSGVTMALMVTEPSLSGISDLERILKTAASFQIKTGVCINKYDTCPELTERIEDYCHKLNIPVLGRVPFDPAVVKTINKGGIITDVSCPAGQAVSKLFDQTMQLITKES